MLGEWNINRNMFFRVINIDKGRMWFSPREGQGGGKVVPFSSFKNPCGTG